MSQKPTIVLVPGAWHSPSCWDKVIALMTAQQYKCISVTLPSTTGVRPVTLLDDITSVRTPILAETTQGRDVVVVAHSYGSIVAASAIKDLTAKASTTSGHVIGMVYIATGFAITGVSFLDGAGGKPPPSWTADVDTGVATIVVDRRELFYHDLPEEEGNLWVSRLTTQALEPLAKGGEYVYSGWKDVPVWFLATVEDKALPFQFQQMLVQMAKDDGGNVTFREVQSSHSPMLSKPEETAGFIMEAAVAFVG